LPPQTAIPAEPTLAYRCLRSLVRLRLCFHRLRPVESERLHQSSAAILAVNAPESLANALLLTAALDQPAVWIFNHTTNASPSRRLAARLLGAITAVDAAGNGQSLERISDALRTGRLVALFPGIPARPEVGGVSPQAQLLAELGQRWTDPAELAVFPVDVFAPPLRLRKWETLIAIGSPIYPREHLHRAEGNPRQAAQSLAAALEQSRGLNAFRLFPSQIERLRAELENLLRADLRDEWAGHADGRQRTEDFELSRFLSHWIEQTNSVDPARLVVLFESVARYRRAHRLWSERRFAVEVAGGWITSSLAQGAVWTESLAGLPVALYGLVNHLPAGLALRVLHRWPKSEKGDLKTQWALLGAVVLAFYALQILLCDRWFGRAAAGYYALTLPVAGAYLWRYARLWKNRTRQLLFKLWIPAGGRRLRKMRRKMALQLDREVVSEAERKPATGGGILSGGEAAR
jgi:hypothetical protein